MDANNMLSSLVDYSASACDLNALREQLEKKVKKKKKKKCRLK